jgi:putative transcriptional regulator
LGALESNLDRVENRVRELRSARELSQGQLGDALGVSRQTINSIENGRYLPSLPLALEIARFFQTTVEHIFIA